MELDGTDYFIVAESMRLNQILSDNSCLDCFFYECSLSFTCENDQKAFYKLIKGCVYKGLRFRI